MPYVKETIERAIRLNPAEQEFHNLNTAARKYSTEYNYAAGFEQPVDVMTAKGIV